MSEMEELFAYNRWANHRLLEAASVLSPDEFTRDLGIARCPTGLFRRDPRECPPSVDDAERLTQPLGVFSSGCRRAYAAVSMRAGSRRGTMRWKMSSAET